MTSTKTQAGGPRAKNRKFQIGMVVAAIGVIGVCVAVRSYWDAEPASAQAPARSTARQTAPPAPAQPDATQLTVMAAVNGQEISRDQLAREALKHYGERVLEHLLRKYLIRQECEARGIAVTQVEVNAEIERMATRFGLAVDQWLKMLQEERNINPRQYANDIIWPSLALDKLAGDRLEVTEQELTEQYESQYGPSVEARLIVCESRPKAEQVRAQAVANPAGFGKLAKAESIDVASASTGGLIQPIRPHTGQKEILEVAFQMREGEISPVLQVGNQFVILKCEGHLPARRVAVEKVKMELLETIRQSKLRAVSDQIFTELQKKAQVQMVLTDPALRRQMPGVSALINGQQVSDRELGELCIDRHGEEVLEGTINLVLLQQACRERNVTVSGQEVDSEIREAAATYLRAKEDGSPNVEAWLELVTKEQGVSLAAYRDTSVWPTVALKKMVGQQVEVSQEDLQRGFEANYGPRVRCLAIVMNNLRQAQLVWGKAQKSPTPEHFGDLAEEYSMESSSRALRGEVPPLQRHGGQPKLEEVAFELAPGELSEIVQSGQHWVILFGLGQTKPVEAEFAEVRDNIYADLYDKKQRLAMAELFQKIQDDATVDNFLSGTTRSPRRVQAAGHQAPITR